VPTSFQFKDRYRKYGCSKVYVAISFLFVDVLLMPVVAVAVVADVVAAAVIIIILGQ